MGSASMGTVLDLGLGHTVAYHYPYHRRYARVYYNRVRIIFIVFFSFYFSVNSLCHAVMQPNIAPSAARTSSLLTITLTPTPFHFKNNVSFSIIMYVLTVYLI